MVSVQYTIENGQGTAGYYAAETAYVYYPWVVIIQPTGRAVLLQFADLDIPPGSLVRRVRVRVTARAPGTVPLADVAEVRPSGTGAATVSSEVIVDFQGLRTVSSIAPTTDSSISAADVKYAPWVGTAFSYQRDLSDFDELATERIKLVFPSAVAIDQLAEEWIATLPSPPQIIDLSVNGGRVWSGGLATPAPPDSEFDVDAEIDITQAVAAGIVAGAVPIRVELTSSSPADLVLEILETDVLHGYDVAFPEGAVRRVDRGEEGAFVLDLPLDGVTDAADAAFSRVELTVSADSEDERIRPAVGPTLSSDAHVLLHSDRLVVVRLPNRLLAPFEVVSGFRLPLGIDEAVELRGDLLATRPDGSGPGEAIDGAVLLPISLSPTDGSYRWTSLLLEETFELRADGLWLAMQPIRGAARLATTELDQTNAADRAELRWRAPSGSYRPLSSPGGLPKLDAAIRIIGIPFEDDPIGSLQAQIATVEDGLVDASPPPTGQRFVIDMADDTVSPDDQGHGGDPSLRLDLTATTPALFTFDNIRVFARPDVQPSEGSST